MLYAKGNQADLAIPAFAKAIEMEPEKYRAILMDELKNLHSALDSVRYNKEFRQLLSGPQ